ncbi:hypothetical protein KUTeg_020954 [Tegillarca granosa]|uniref:G-protein coupled receptors family 1 profile domain-containing protein n=1 Tax=Tegillarca granosa TaxID=220873 RepID=A0ABQ9EDJ6_TEGGR|nr:hypothetical protein KUTeg_020954 [Tegillarca granosa]
MDSNQTYNVFSETNFNKHITYNITTVTTEPPTRYYEETPLYNVAFILRNIFIPSIVLIGVAGNSLSICVFTSVHLRSSSSSSFLAALAFADNVFLLSLLVTWIDRLSNVLTSEASCQALIYITYIASFLSVWFIVGFTLERYVAICHPLHAKMICSSCREKIGVLILTIFSFVFYNYAIWTSSIAHDNGKYKCVHKEKYLRLLETFTWVDTFITMFLPFILIIIMNVKVVIRASAFYRQRRQCLSPKFSEKIQLRRSMRIKPQMRVTRTLLAVSTTFLILNLPSHVLRLYTLILYLTENTQAMLSKELYFLQEIAQLFYYTTFCVNFFLYAAYGKQFKRSLMLMIKPMYFSRKQNSLHRLERMSITKATML